MRQDFKSAEREYEHNLYAWKCHRPGHLHDSPEAYTNLANVQFALAKYREAGENYLNALKMDPNFEQARRNLAITRARAPGIPAEPARR